MMIMVGAHARKQIAQLIMIEDHIRVVEGKYVINKNKFLDVKIYDPLKLGY